MTSFIMQVNSYSQGGYVQFYVVLMDLLSHNVY